MQSTSARKEKPVLQKILPLFYIISAIFILYYLIAGWDFYTSGYQLRPRLEDYRLLRPAGFRGHAFGILGTLMMLLMLLYSLRKRTRFFGDFLPLSTWLKVHIYLGIFGPLLVVLHTSFKINGLVAVSFWSMVAVALSGVLGRYLYLQIPRTIAGNEINLTDLENTNIQLSSEITVESSLDDQTTEKLVKQYLGKLQKNNNLFTLLIKLIWFDMTRPLRNLRLKNRLQKQYNIPSGTVGEMVELIRNKALLHRRIIFWNHIHQMFHYWHIVHKPFAFVMYLILLVHVGVAAWMGYTWIF
ncbi:MAG: hypothetical protein WAN36_01730 [Calditrichia bacterium]